jgi:hypothetical protein
MFECPRNSKVSIGMEVGLLEKSKNRVLVRPEF